MGYVFNPFTGLPDYTNPTGTSSGGTGISGTISAAQVAFGAASDSITGDDNLYWNNTDKRLGIGTTAPGYDLDVNGDFQVASGTAKSYRFKTSGGALDFDASGANLYVSVYSAANYGGTQRKYMIAKYDSHIIQAMGYWEFKADNNEFGDTFAVIDQNGYVFNESGADADFRVEGDTDTDLLFVDAGNDLVQLGKLNINGAYTLANADGTNGQVLVTNGSGSVSWGDKQAVITGAATTITSSDLTTSRALVSGTTGKVEVSAVTLTELGYVSGVTSAIQTQFTGKLGTVGGTISGNLSLSQAAGNARYIQYQTSGSLRWQVGANASAESGSGAGSDYVLNRYDDTGSYVDTPFYMTRNDGQAYFSANVNTSGRVVASYPVNSNVAGEPPSDHSADGPKMNMLAAGTAITVMNLVYLSTSDGRWYPTDADAESTTAGLLGIALATGTAASNLSVAIKGAIVRDDTWAWTVGQTLYASTSPGEITSTAPSGSSDTVRVVGYAITDDAILFSPSEEYSVIT